MTGKDFLISVPRSFLILNSKLEQFACLQDTVKKINAVIDGTPSVSNKDFSRIESAVTAALNYSTSVADAVGEFILLHKSAMREINKIQSFDEKLILEYRYLAFKSWAEIADLMHVSLRYIYKLHGHALESFEKIFSAGDKKAQKDTNDTLTDTL